jgi:hypothetical protein
MLSSNIMGFFMDFLSICGVVKSKKNSQTIFSGGKTMIPQDPVILLSFINTQLRDNYGSLEALAEGLDLSQEELDNIVSKLKSLGYEYHQGQNKFV